MSPTSSLATAKRGVRILITIVGVALAFVIVAPVALSSQDLYDWAGSGLGLDEPMWQWAVFIALDACAVICIAIAVIASWISVPAPIHSFLVWLFAGASAFANYRQGSHSNTAPDAVWFFPLMSLLGPLMLEACLQYLRKVLRRERAEAGEERLTLARWVLAFWTTFRAWRLTKLDGRVSISQALDTVDPRRIPPAPEKTPQRPSGGAGGGKGRRTATPVHNLHDIAEQIPPQHRRTRDELAAALRERGVPISTDKAGVLHRQMTNGVALA